MLKDLKELCTAFGPSGNEDEVRDLIIKKTEKYADSITEDKVGNLIVFKKGKKRRDKKVMYSSHMDEVGFMIRHFGEDGYLYFGAIGGISRAVAGGRRLVIGDNRLPGIISAKAIHLQKQSERGVCIPIEEMYINIGCDTDKQAKEYVSLGDTAVFEPNYEDFGDGLVKSKALDDRAGCTVLIDMIKSGPEYDTWFAFTCCEEIGTRGAAVASHETDADVVITVEATTAADIGGVPKEKQCCAIREGAVISHMDNGTIYDKGLFALSQKIAKENGIKYQIKNLVAGGNDSSAFQKGADGARVLAVSLPARYIHTACSVIAKEDLFSVRDLAVKLNENI